MKSFRHPWTVVLGTTFFFFIIFVLIFLPWTPDFFNSVLKESVLFLVLIYVGIFSLLYFLFYLIYRSYTYEIGDGLITIKHRGIFNTSKTYSFYNPLKTAIDLRENFLRDIANETKFVLYSEGKKVFSLVLSKDEAMTLTDSISVHAPDKKVYFVKNRDFVYDQKNFLLVLFDNFFITVFLDFLLLSLFSAFKWNKIVIGSYSTNIYLLTTLLLLLIYIITVAFTFIHAGNTRVKIDNEALTYSRGRLFRRNGFVSLGGILNISASETLLSRVFDSYYVTFGLAKGSSIRLPLKRENIDSLIKRPSDEYTNLKSSFKWPYFIILIILASLGAFGLSYLSFLLSLAFAIVVILYTLGHTLFSYSIVQDNSIIYRTAFFSKQYILVDVRSLKRVSFLRLPFGYFHVVIESSIGKRRLFINRKECDQIKKAIGYFKQ